jgi:acyl-CoA synthetase (NDP forming)
MTVERHQPPPPPGGGGSGWAATSALAAPARLRRFFAPHSVALVGGSEFSGWARNVVESLQVSGFEGPLHLVHARRRSAFGRPTVPRLRDLGEPVDLAFLFTPTEAVEEVLEDAGEASVPGVVVLAAGFAERGGAGRELERRLVERAARHGITLLGPNGLGFVNATARVAPYGLKIEPPLLAGPVGVVLQSGALASAVLGFTRAHAIGLSLLVSMGNEAMLTTADVLAYLLEDEGTRVVALFLEGIRQPDRFWTLAERAQEAGKPLVALKVGRSPGGRRAALAHTGALAGDDAVVDAALRQMGVIRVRSLEELLVTAHLLGYWGPLPGRRMGVVSASGGACDIVVDRADEEGLEVAEFGPDTVRALERALPDFTNPTNPVDATGFGLANQTKSTVPPLLPALAAVTQDQNLDFVLNLGLSTTSVRSDPRWVEEMAAIVRASPRPVVSATTTCTDVPGDVREVLTGQGLDVLAGLELAMSAIGHGVRWSETRSRRPRRARERPPADPWRGPLPEGAWSEVEARALLAEAGVPLVPAELARTQNEAVAAARRIGFPVVLKLCSAQIPHKSDVGGVAVGLETARAVREAFGRLQRAARAVPGVRLEGVLVSPLRRGGYELLAGVAVDATFGPVLAVGLGGVWVEALRDTALRVLPVTPAEARRMLDELRGAALLRGGRGREGVDADRVAEVLVRVSAAAARLGPSLVAVEVNPLWCRGRQVEGLDVMVETRTARKAA